MRLLTTLGALDLAACATDDAPPASTGTTTGTAGLGGTSSAGGSGGSVAGSSSGSSGHGGASGAPVAGSGGSGGTLSTGGAGGTGVTSGTGGSGGVSSPGGTSGAAGGPTEPWASRPEVPAAEGGQYPVCGPDQSTPGGFGFHGSCCMDVVCRAPSTQTGLCPEPSEIHRGAGSGTCDCGATQGPFKADAAHESLTAGGQGCCYVAGIITCDGRPLFIDGRQRAARLRAASVWG